MGPGALPSGEIEHRAALSLLLKGAGPRPARAFLLGWRLPGIPPRVEIACGDVSRGDVSRGLEISRWSLVDRLGGIDGSGVKAVKAGAR